MIRNFLARCFSQTQIDRSINDLAKQLSEGKFKQISFLLGAGISVNAGIPDFRSKEGVYSTFTKSNPPETMLNIEYFKENPNPYYKLKAKILKNYPFKPTLTHYFLSFIQDKKLLNMVFTQNFDCLELDAGVLPENLVQSHGTYRRGACTKCHKKADPSKILKHLLEGEPLLCEKCQGFIKPDIVFFGEMLPDDHYLKSEELFSSDLCFIIGTGMLVKPFAYLERMVLAESPRIIINKESTVELDFILNSNPKNVFLTGDCDDIITKILKASKWLEEFENVKAKRNL